jgi:predicted O-methyltransferase YrrM
MDLLQVIKQKSLENHIPIVRDKTLQLMIDIINKNKYQSVLEIGTAYGYSAYTISKCKNIKSIITLEKRIDNYLIAKQYKNNKITYLNDDAFFYTPTQTFDFIFIDGGKSHQEHLVDKYYQHLNKGGIIFIDNIDLHKFDQLDVLTKNQKSLLNKIKVFKK